MKLVGMPRGGQKAIHGTAVNVPSKLQPVFILLPRLPSTADVVHLKLKRKLSDTGHYMHEYIQPKKVIEALQWLQQNNPLYKDITIFLDWERQWEDDDPDLWEAIANACHEEMEVSHEDEADTVADNSLSVSSAPLSPLPTGDDYTILSHLAKRRKLQLKDVPDANYPNQALHVFKTNKEVDDRNNEHLRKLPTQVFDIKAIDQKKDVQTGIIDINISAKPSDTGGLRETVSVAVGARVMVTVNINVSDGLANGVCGTVVGIEHTGNDVHVLLVEFDSERVVRKATAGSQYRRTFPAAVPISRQDVQFFVGRGRRSVEAKRKPFPLSLAWSCTIHKVQGKTLDKVIVSMEGRGSFMPGQAYVALSRVKNLAGLFLLGFDAAAIRVNPAVVKEMTRLRQRVLPSTVNSIDEPHSLNIRLLNVRSYLEHLEDLRADNSVKNVDVFCYDEYFLKQQQDIDLVIPNAQSFRADRSTAVGQGGGVMTVARQEVLPTDLQLAITGVEYTVVSVKKGGTQINIVTLYRPPSTPPAVFIQALQALIRSLPDDTIILGDFTFDLLQSSHHNIISFMEKHGFNQEVQVPTTDYGTLLDHVYIRNYLGTEVKVLYTYFSDHDTVCVSLKI
ncbi:hypothetical protein Bbelb_361660 [Xyrichtys novacula]|uniref:DUF6570 domain-containing protein n=1 Tax=Xyrichtys novacula TaxID=13765 RepID=A0AAV1HMH1_XYRNO|nr:hypothetical protein Bbelb_361660 [Xyrichtys novacula]